MNIFVLDDNPRISAIKLKELDPLRYRKQIVELTQILAQRSPVELPKKNGEVYKINKSIANHPASIWTDSKKENRQWTIQYLSELIFIYDKEHGCQKALEVVLNELDGSLTTNISFGWFSKKVEQKELSNNIFEAVEKYIKAKQQGLFKN